MAEELEKSGGSTTAQSILENLNKIEDTPDEKDDKIVSDDDLLAPMGKATKSDDDDDEEEVIKIEGESEDDDFVKKYEAENELELSAKIPSRKEILEYDPKLFKKFPTLEHAIYREKQYAELFPTLDDAKQASERSQVLENFEKDLLGGNIDNVLKVVKQNDGKAYDRIVGGFLDNLRTSDPHAHLKIMNRAAKQIINYVFQHGKKEGDEQLQLASQYMHKFIFNSTEVTPDSEQVVEKENPRENEQTERERNFARTELTSAVTDVTSNVNKRIKSTIEKHLDPNGSMSSYVKSKSIDDVMVELDKAMSGDKRFRLVLDTLWKRAQSSRYNDSSKQEIRRTLEGKAAALLLPIIRKVRATALKDGQVSKKKSDETEDEPITKTSRDRVPAKTLSSNKSDKARKSGESTLDYLTRMG